MINFLLNIWYFLFSYIIKKNLKSEILFHFSEPKVVSCQHYEDFPELKRYSFSYMEIKNEYDSLLKSINPNNSELYEDIIVLFYDRKPYFSNGNKNLDFIFDFFKIYMHNQIPKSLLYDKYNVVSYIVLQNISFKNADLLDENFFKNVMQDIENLIKDGKKIKLSTNPLYYSVMIFPKPN